MDMNVFIGEGFIGSDPKIDYVGDKGTPKCFFTIANHRGFNSNERVNWIPCVIWGERAEKIMPHLSKGLKVTVMGEVTFSAYEEDGGWKKYVNVNVRELSFHSSGTRSEQAEEPPSPFSGTEEDIPITDVGDLL